MFSRSRHRSADENMRMAERLAAESSQSHSVDLMLFGGAGLSVQKIHF